MELSPASPALGTVVRGVDLREPLTSDDLDVLRTELARTWLLHFPEQTLDDDQHAEVVGRFGPVALEGGYAVGFVSNAPNGVLGSGAACFHSDYAFTDDPYLYLSLYGLEIPTRGTETYFCNAVAAARDLPIDLRCRVEQLRARATVDVASEAREAGVRIDLGRLDESYPHATRPVLWPHRSTGDPILAVWEQQTDAVLPLADDEGDELVRELFAHLYRPAHVMVHQWQPGDLLVWDNHALQHARPEVGSQPRRVLRRVCVGVAPDLSIFAARMAERGVQA